MIAFIKDQRSIHGVEPICRFLQIAPSTFYVHLAIERDPSRASDRAKRDAYLRTEMVVFDVMAFDVLFELQWRGTQVPEDVAVMGVHDLPFAQAVVPKLSTVRLPTCAMGARAAEAMARWLDEDVLPEPICLDAKLIPRETT